MKSGIPMDAAFAVKNVQRIPLTSGGEYTQLDIPLYALSQLKVECDALTAQS